MKKLGFVLFVLIILYFIFLIRQDIMDNLDLRKSEERLHQNLQQETELAQRLSNRLKLLKQKSYIEKLARTRLGFVKQGEKAYKVIRR